MAELVLVMVVGFILIHSAPFLGSVMLASDAALKNRLLAFAGLTAFYDLFIGAFAMAFKAWWPLIAFAWLITAKLVILVTDRRHTERQKLRMRGYWGVSFGYFLLAVFATAFIPLPEFGITRHGAAYGLYGNSGEWVRHPHIAISAGFLYFGLLAATKLVERPAWWRLINRESAKRS